MVLFLFVVMMLDMESSMALREKLLRYFPWAVVVALLVSWLISLFLYGRTNYAFEPM